MSEERATWFCIDIECTGPVPGLYDMISLGAVVVKRGRASALEHAAARRIDPPPAR